MFPMRNFLLPFLSACLMAPALFAQTFRLPPISFTGAAAYSQTDLLKLSGLHPGDISTQSELQKAAQRLNNTGFFADIRYQSDSRGLVFALKPMPASQLLPARFNNFVWWSSQELNAALKARVPLYTGEVPLEGNTQDAIISALKAMVAEEGVTANVIAIPQVQPGASPTSISFVIDTPQVVIHSLTFADASPAMQAKLGAIVKSQTGQPFELDDTRSSITASSTKMYRDAGYLDIALTDLTHPKPTITANTIDLDLTATISEGEPYRLTSLIWSGSDIMSAADFNKSVSIKPGEIASQQALQRSLGALAHAYYVKGFQDAKVQAVATTDHATHHVAYTVNVIPGDQYHFRSIKTIGLTSGQQKQFDSAWQMHPGDVYDVTYLTEFLKTHPELATLRGFSATYKEYSDPNTHLVDLVLTFSKGGTLVNAN